MDIVPYVFIAAYWVLFLLGSYFRVFQYIYDLYYRPGKVFNQRLIRPYYREYFVFHLLTAWVCVAVLMPLCVAHNDIHAFNQLNLFIWISSVVVVAAGLNRNNEVYGVYIGRFVVVRNVAELGLALYVTFVNPSHSNYILLLYGIWFHRIIDTYPRSLLRARPLLNFCVVLTTYALTIGVSLFLADKIYPF